MELVMFGALPTLCFVFLRSLTTQFGSDRALRGPS
jgi:hypothetical protein